MIQRWLLGWFVKLDYHTMGVNPCDWSRMIFSLEWHPDQLCVSPRSGTGNAGDWRSHMFLSFFSCSAFHHFIKTITGWWFGAFFIFPYIGIIIPIDFHISQRGGPTTNQKHIFFTNRIAIRSTLWKWLAGVFIARLLL